MRVGIIRYPGSNCDSDVLRYFDDSVYIWHKETVLPDNIDIIIIPGGFAFGDREYESATGKYKISPGAMAIKSPVTNVIKEAHKKKIPILGICNGFQILLKLGLLDGELIQNVKKKFDCQIVKCQLTSTIFSHLNEQTITIPIANGYGNYYIDKYNYQLMEKNDQIIMKYVNYSNGSIYEIAGVSNKEKTVFGMMPHPERLYNSDFFTKFVEAIINKEENDLKKNINMIMSSEHVSYKSTKKYLSTLFTNSKHVIQGPGENAGIVDIGDGYCIALRIESHNHPIFIEPYQGASTGVGGILRDIFTMGARPIGILDFLRFGVDSYSENLVPRVIKGIADYGNCIGVPNLGGDFYKGETYNKNPVLNVGCIGIVKKENIIYGNALNEGSYLIYVGGKTGNDGIGGADMASKGFTSKQNNAEMEENIQHGDPFLEKLLLEACCEIAELKLVEGMQDMGAAGLLCSTVEVIERGRKKTGKDLGCQLNLNKVPLKSSTLSYSDILLSESQERMLIISTPENKDAIFNIFKKWDLEAEVIGIVNNTGKYSVCDNNNILYEQKFDDFIYPTEEWEGVDVERKYEEIKKIKNKELWKEYDTSIGCRTIKGPLDISGDYTLLDIYEVKKKLVITWGDSILKCNDKIKELGGTSLGVVNGLNFGHPKDSMFSFAKEVAKMNNECKQLQIPILGGNVSLYNTTDDISIKPTVVLLMIGLI